MFKVIQEKIEEKKLLDCVVNWSKMHKSNTTENSVLFFSRKGDFLTVYSKKKIIKSIGIILVEKNLFQEACFSYDIPFLPQEWQKIAETKVFELWERYTGEPQNMPMRLGFSDKEKKDLLFFARETITNFLLQDKATIVNSGHDVTVEKTRKYDAQQFLEKSPERYKAKTRIDVALWVDGHLRGSQIVERETIAHAIYDASVNATRDIRFKPLNTEELSGLRIEITFMSDLLLPVTSSDIRANEIWTTKGYVALAEGGAGWFVPAVFNCLAFDGLSDFLQVLTTRKLNIASKAPSYFYFNVIDWIETEKNYKSLRGPVVENNINFKKNGDIESVIAKDILRYLHNNIEKDGNIIFSYNPISGESSSIDWVRNAFAAWSLVLYGEVFNNENSKQIGFLQYSYLKENIGNTAPIESYLYLSYAAYLYHDETFTNFCNEYIYSHYKKNIHAPLFALQVGLFFLEERNRQQKMEDISLRIALDVLESFMSSKRDGADFPLAMFSDLVPLLVALSKVFGSEDLQKKANDVASWYIEKQNPDGSFPSSVNSIESYSRGTIKILESLARSGLVNGEDAVIKKGIAWIYDMQYREDSMFFIPQSRRDSAFGGIRHDNHNAAIWIDSEAHTLLLLSFLRH